MTRSDMVQKILETLNYLYETRPTTDNFKGWANKILDVVESHGMLPPRRPGRYTQSLQNHEWEKEKK